MEHGTEMQNKYCYIILGSMKYKALSAFFPHRVLSAESIVVVVVLVVIHLHGALALRRHHHRQAEARCVIVGKLNVQKRQDRGQKKRRGQPTNQSTQTTRTSKDLTHEQSINGCMKYVLLSHSRSIEAPLQPPFGTEINHST